MSPRGSMVDLSDISGSDISESENKVNLDSICISDISDRWCYGGLVLNP